MKNNRILNVVLTVVCFLLLLALPIRKLLIRDGGPGARGEGFDFATYILLFLFGSLTLVFAYRAITDDRKGKGEK